MACPAAFSARILKNVFFVYGGSIAELPPMFYSCLLYTSLGVILIPVCQPVPEGHLRPHFFGLQPAAFLLELLELLNALLLRFGENIFRLGIAVIIVANDDTPLPPTVFALSYGSVAGFSLSCHGRCV